MGREGEGKGKSEIESKRGEGRERGKNRKKKSKSKMKGNHGQIMRMQMQRLLDNSKSYVFTPPTIFLSFGNYKIDTSNSPSLLFRFHFDGVLLQNN